MEFTDAVLVQGCKLSMDGRGAWRQNVFVERVWRSVKYERAYLKAYQGVSVARADIELSPIEWTGKSLNYAAIRNSSL